MLGWGAPKQRKWVESVSAVNLPEDVILVGGLTGWWNLSVTLGQLLVRAIPEIVGGLRQHGRAPAPRQTFGGPYTPQHKSECWVPPTHTHTLRTSWHLFACRVPCLQASCICTCRTNFMDAICLSELPAFCETQICTPWHTLKSCLHAQQAWYTQFGAMMG